MSNRQLLTILTLVVLIGPVASQCPAADAVPDPLLDVLPSAVNAVAIVRVRVILATPRAQQEGWESKQAERFLAGAAAVPPWAERVVVGSLVRPNVPEEVWSVALIPFPAGEAAPPEARWTFERTEMIAGRAGAHLPGGGLFLQLRPDLLGVMRAAQRQEVSRWLHGLDEGRTGASAYLSSASASPAHVVLALDTQDMLAVGGAQRWLAATAALEGQAPAVATWSRLLAGMRGVRFEATVGQTITGELHLDFGEAANVKGDVARRLVLEALDSMQTSLPDFENAEVAVSGGTVTLRAELSDESLRHILSLVFVPPPSSPGPTKSEPPARDRAIASSKYFAAVDRILTDLDKSNRRGAGVARTATWHDASAKKIQDLPAEEADRELVAYGDRVSSNLRALAASLRGTAVEVGAQQQAVTYDASVDPGWGGVSVWSGGGWQPPSWHVSSNLAEVRQRQADAIATGQGTREQVWQIINDDRAEVLRLMRERYGDGFAKEKGTAGARTPQTK